MTQPTETETIWVTQEAYDRLKQELEHLAGDVRADITAKIAAAREEGDLKENGGYHLRARSRARPKPASASSRTCCAAPRSATSPQTTGSSRTA